MTVTIIEYIKNPVYVAMYDSIIRKGITVNDIIEFNTEYASSISSNSNPSNP
jgi:hypothetical protein